MKIIRIIIVNDNMILPIIAVLKSNSLLQALGLLGFFKLQVMFLSLCRDALPDFWYRFYTQL